MPVKLRAVAEVTILGAKEGDVVHGVFVSRTRGKGAASPVPDSDRLAKGRAKLSAEIEARDYFEFKVTSVHTPDGVPYALEGDGVDAAVRGENPPIRLCAWVSVASTGCPQVRIQGAGAGAQVDGKVRYEGDSRGRPVRGITGDDDLVVGFFPRDPKNKVLSKRARYEFEIESVRHAGACYRLRGAEKVWRRPRRLSSAAEGPHELEAD